MDCPIDSAPDSLAALIPSATARVPYTELVAAPIAYKTSAAEDGGDGSSGGHSTEAR